MNWNNFQNIEHYYKKSIGGGGGLVPGGGGKGPILPGDGRGINTIPPYNNIKKEKFNNSCIIM